MEKITLEQLLAGAILKFKWVDSLDITLLTGGLKNRVVLDEVGDLSKYIQHFLNIVSLKDNLTLDSNISPIKENPYSLRKHLEQKQGDIVKEYLSSLDMNMFVLRKIKHLPLINMADLKYMFNEVELTAISELFAMGLITSVWNDDLPYEDYEELVLTKQGEVELYLIDSQSSVESFVSVLESRGFDSSLLKDFLATVPNLEDYILSERSIPEFELFGSLYDRAVLK